MKPPKKLSNGKKSDVTPALIDEEGGRHAIPSASLLAEKIVISEAVPEGEALFMADRAYKKGESVSFKLEGIKAKSDRTWYDWTRPFVGIKWGATLVLLFYSFFEGLSDPRLMWACIIVGLFLFLEWLDLGIKDFRRVK